MAAEIVSSLTVKVLELLGKSVAQKIAPYFGGRRKLSELQGTMEMIQARLSDAEKRQEAEQGELIKVWLKKLKDVMYRLEDLLEVFIADYQQNEQRSSGKISKVVSFLPSKLSSLKINKRLSQQAGSIMKELDSITTNMERFNFNDQSLYHQERYGVNMRPSKEETHSFVREELVIGRDEDKREILEMLLDCDEGGERFSVMSIVGMGGLGKTTLAQLIYNDISVGHQQLFDFKSWACISDQISSFEELAGKVLHSITGVKVQSSSVEELQLKLRQAVKDKRFLLVFDDVWDDDYGRWFQLKSLLLECKPGSKILVTTRSEGVAKNMGDVEPYKLSGLSEEKSWELFKSIALEGQREKVNPNLESIGREIAAKCANVPLAICTIAGHLYSRDTREYWVHLLDKEFRMIDEAQDRRVMQILKISYDHLRSHQKQCFAYCSLFPKDYKFDVRRLIQLWMAQGFVRSLVDGYICFMELLRTSFFQNVERNWNNTESCQMHDLMHDLAQMVGTECLLLDGSRKNVIENIRHARIVDSSCRRSESLHAFPQIRSWLVDQDDLVNASPIILSFSQLRALALRCENFPRSIGQLKHLRYLEARVSSEYLPGEITKLQFLQTLDLSYSCNLRELPKEFHRLSSLKHLHMEGVYSLIDMPPRFRELESLQSLDTFVAGTNTGTDALARMNLVGMLRIDFKKHRPNEVAEAMNANLKGKQLTDLELWFNDSESLPEAYELLLECLQPPPNLKGLIVHSWKGTRFPKWMDLGDQDCADSSVQVYLRSLESLSLSRLPEVKTLPSGIFQIATLQQLYLACLDIETLPESIGNLTQLRVLRIESCHQLQALPKSIQNLTALESFTGFNCKMLKKRYAKPHGDEWPLIQHIPQVRIL